MTVRLYLKSGITEAQEPKACFYGKGERPYLAPSIFGFECLSEIDETLLSNVLYVTIEESYWKEVSGYSFAAGCYEGDGFEVTISPSYAATRGGSAKDNGFTNWKQEISGRFDTLEIAKSFWRALTRGELLPIRPLCRELNLTEQTYAKQASLAVGFSTRISELESTITVLMNQLKAQGQIIQDHVLTPAK